MLNYEKETNFKKTLEYIDTNQSMLDFSTSTIAHEYQSNIWGLRLEGLVLRVRIVFYTTLIVSMVSFPTICSLIIFFIECIYILIYFYYSIRYRNMKNWILLISKINMGISILTISLASLFISLTEEEPSSFKN